MPSIFSEPLCRCCADESRCPVDSDYAIGHLPFSSPPCNVDPAHRNLPYLPVSEPSTSFDHIGSNLTGEKRCGKRNCITRRAASPWRPGSAWMTQYSSDERRIGTERVSPCRTPRSRYNHTKQKLLHPT